MVSITTPTVTPVRSPPIPAAFDGEFLFGVHKAMPTLHENNASQLGPKLPFMTGGLVSRPVSPLATPTPALIRSDHESPSRIGAIAEAPEPDVDELSRGLTVKMRNISLNGSRRRYNADIRLQRMVDYNRVCHEAARIAIRHDARRRLASKRHARQQAAF